MCIFACPWPRIQAALTDEWALNVTYRRDRGEPRKRAILLADPQDRMKPAIQA
jgi:polyferredoxin